MNILKYNHLIFDKEAKEHALEERQDLQQIVLGNLHVYPQKSKIGATPITAHKNQLWWSGDLTLEPEAVKILEENMSSNPKR